MFDSGEHPRRKKKRTYQQFKEAYKPISLFACRKKAAKLPLPPIKNGKENALCQSQTPNFSASKSNANSKFFWFTSLVSFNNQLTHKRKDEERKEHTMENVVDLICNISKGRCRNDGVTVNPVASHREGRDE